MSELPSPNYSYNTSDHKQPYRCPVCDGTGLVSRPPNVAGDVESWPASETGPYQCKVCNGTGVLWN